MTKKPSAKDRNIDIFTGTTELEKAISSAEIVEAQYKKEPAEPLEYVIDARRDYAVQMAEYVSKSWLKPIQDKAGQSTFRITQKGDWSFLEELRHAPSGVAYFWSGLMYRTENQHELTNVMLKASKGLLVQC